MIEWRPIPGYGGVFEASDDGQIRRTVRGATVSSSRVVPYLMNQTMDSGTGYYRVKLTYRGKRKLDHVHRLVLMAFDGAPEQGMVGAHLNGIKTDNRRSNLAWVTQKENMSHKHLHGTAQTGDKANSSKLSERDIPSIFADRAGGAKQVDLAAKYGVSQAAIWLILARKTWAHVPISELTLASAATRTLLAHSMRNPK